MHALVVDDSKAMRSMIANILREVGFKVTEAANGLEALESLHNGEDTQLALVDWNMPEMDGFDFVRAVRAEPAYDVVRLVMVTTTTEMDQVARALEAGANEYIMKPFTKEVILEKLDLLGMLSN